MKKKLFSLWAIILFVFITIALPYYVPKDGYSFIGTNKCIFFFYGMLLLFGLYVLLDIISLGRKLHIHSMVISKKTPKHLLLNFSKTDFFVVGFALCCMLSYLFSYHKDIALFGNDEWYMGLVSQLLFVFIYFGISRHLQFSKWLIYTLCIVNVPLAFLAIVNRFGFYPLSIKGTHPLYVSSIGNINWFCGYFIIIVGLELIIYFYSSTLKYKLLSGFCLFFSLLALICQGSISGYVTLFVLLILLLKPALAKKQTFLTYLEILLLLFLGCTLTYVSKYFIPYAYVEYDAIINLVAFSILPCICLFIVAILYIVITMRVEKLNLSFLYKYIVFSLVTIFVGYLFITLINTLFPNVMPFLNEKSFFTFDRFWWSTRGGTYAIGAQAFWSLPWYQKFFGIGPDCFLTYVYDNLDLVTVAKYFKIQPLANAHNEFLTMLVNTGILGCITYIGIFVTSIKNALKLDTVISKIIVFGILGYMINNVFSFQQVVSTPVVFVLIGLLENFLRKEKENVTN